MFNVIYIIKDINTFFKNISQGSAKLEKAEILQMTVDHLKMLHAAGGKGGLILHIHTPTRDLVFV